MSEENQSNDFLASEGQEDIIGISLVGSVNPLVSVTCETAPFKSTVLEGGGITRRTRTLTEKGYAYQLETKSRALKSKQSELTKLMRSTLLLRGHNNDVSAWKRELSRCQILWSEFGDIYNEIKEICKETDLLPINSVWGQVCSEWNNFELTANSEIQYLQEVRTETVSKSSKNTHRTRKSRKSKASSIFTSTTENEKYELQKEEAALKIKLAFAKEEQKLKIEQKRAEVLCLGQESKLEALKLKRELAENQAQCMHEI